jgi:hypothetical protein
VEITVVEIFEDRVEGSIGGYEYRKTRGLKIVQSYVKTSFLQCFAKRSERICCTAYFRDGFTRRIIIEKSIVTGCCGTTIIGE